MRTFTAALWLSFMATVANAQSVTPFEFYRSSDWTMYQQYWKHAFDTCLAERNELDDGKRLSIGRAITGDDFIMVHNIKALVPDGTAPLAGKVWINGKTPYDYSNVTAYDSVSTAGEKYVTIYLANGFVEQFAKANTVDVEFPNGRSKHSLKGSRDVIQRLNTCMDDGLKREMDAPAPVIEVPPLRTPLNWTAGTSAEGQGGRYIAIKLPQQENLPAFILAYVESAPARFDIRLRLDEASLSTRVDPAAAGAKRVAVNVLMNDVTAFATLAVYQGNSFDILDIPAADLMKLATTGKMSVKPLDPSMPQDAFIMLNVDASFGPGAIVNAAAPAPPPVDTALTLEELAGTYLVRGQNPNGSYYYGTADTVMEGSNLRINWKWSNGKTDTAVANMVERVVTAVVTGLAAPAIYTIGKDGTWRGTWDNGKATEVMVPKL